MKLEEYILTYKSQSDGKILANVPDYYDMFVQPVDKKFKAHSLNSDRLVVCPFHDDNDPSLGLINDRFYKGVKKFHCFGCRTAGNIIVFHQKFESLYNKRNLDTHDACMELAQIFGIPVEDFEELADDDYEGKYVRTMKHIDDLQGAYTLRDFELDLRKVRGKSEVSNLAELNSASVKMIATVKQLYSY